jgi:hypothetical protein
MILGDLLGVHVYDDDGARLGRVADARGWETCHLVG